MDELRAFDLDLAERLPLIGSGRGDQVWQRRVDTSGRKCGGARVGRGPIGRQLAVGDGAHARPMTTLAGKDERLARGRAQRRPRDERMLASGGQRAQALGEFQPVGGPKHRPMPTDPSGLAQLPSHFGHGRSRKALEVVGDGPSVRPDQFLGMGAEQTATRPSGSCLGAITPPHTRGHARARKRCPASKRSRGYWYRSSRTRTPPRCAIRQRPATA